MKDMQAENILTLKEQVLFALILGVIIAIGSLANLIVLWVLYREKMLRRNIASILLVNLVIIDFSNLVLVMPFSLVAVASQTWEMGDGLKKMNAFIGTTLELVSMLALAVISLDRLAAVMKPLDYRARMTSSKAFQLNAYIWIQAIIFSLIPIPSGWYIFNHRYKSSTFVSEHPSIGFYIYMVFLIGCNFVFSLFVILATYFYIFRVARSHSKRIACAIMPASIFDMTNKSRKAAFRQREIRTALKILFVIGAFVICHLPYATMRILELSYHSKYGNPPSTLTVAVKWASYSKSALDPFIYCLLQKRFRKAFITLLKRKNSIQLSRERTLSLKSERKQIQVSTFEKKQVSIAATSPDNLNTEFNNSPETSSKREEKTIAYSKEILPFKGKKNDALTQDPK